MQLKFGLLSQKILPFVKEYFIFVISPSEKCGGINQPRLIYFWGGKNWALEVMGVSATKIKSARGTVWTAYFRTAGASAATTSAAHAMPPLPQLSSPSLGKATLVPWQRAALWDAKRENYLFLAPRPQLFRGSPLPNSPTAKFHVSGLCHSILFFWEQMSVLWRAKTWLSLEKKTPQDVLLSWRVPLLWGGSERGGWSG